MSGGWLRSESDGVLGVREEGVPEGDVLFVFCFEIRGGDESRGVVRSDRANIRWV